MVQSTKLGLASLILVASAVLPPTSRLPEPIGFCCCVIACVLAFLASRQGSKWWLAIPAMLAVVTAISLYVALHSY
jgi:uncharacterized membrane protein